MGDAVENNFLRCRLSPLNRVLFGVSVQQDVHFRHFRNPTAIDLAVKLDRELHSHRLPPLMRTDARASGGATTLVDQIAGSAGLEWLNVRIAVRAEAVEADPRDGVKPTK